MSNNLIYRETQKFGLVCFWGIGLCWAIALGVMGYTYFNLKTAGKLSNDFYIPFILVMGVLTLVEILFFSARLVIEVRESGIFIRYIPFHLHFKEIPLDTCIKVQAVSYSPLGDYGGWGIRYAPKGRCYNCKGTQGVKLEFANGKHIMLGTQKPQELEAAIRLIWKEGSPRL